jgi:hypothetical protein
LSEPYDRDRETTTETTEDQLGRVLGRALNSFELPDEMVERLLDSAFAHATSLHSSHHSRLHGSRSSLSGAGGDGSGRLNHETYRHSYLLSDGGSLVLWELIHSIGPGGLSQHELYASEEEVRLAASRLRRAHGSTPFVDADDEAAEFGGELLGTLLSAPVEELPRAYVPDNSADHARRVLRRAENEDRPGEETAERLRAALAHQITQSFGRQCRIGGQNGQGGRDAGFTVYEHAFLLLDSSEVSLWEVEHTATPDGRHMCEVYESEPAARAAMERRARLVGG